MHRAFPGFAMLRERFRRCHALFRNHTFESGKPMMVVGFSGVGITGGLSFLDCLAEHRRRLTPGEQTFFVWRQGHGKRVGFPRSAKDRTAIVAWNARNRLGSTPRGFRIDGW